MKPIITGTRHADRRLQAKHQLHDAYHSALSVLTWVNLGVNLLDEDNDTRVYLKLLSRELILSVTELNIRCNIRGMSAFGSIRRINKYTEEIRSATMHIIDEVTRLKLNEEYPQVFDKEVLIDRANKGNFESEETDNTSK